GDLGCRGTRSTAIRSSLRAAPATFDRVSLPRSYPCVPAVARADGSTARVAPFPCCCARQNCLAICVSSDCYRRSSSSSGNCSFFHVAQCPGSLLSAFGRILSAGARFGRDEAWPAERHRTPARRGEIACFQACNGLIFVRGSCNRELDAFPSCHRSMASRIDPNLHHPVHRARRLPAPVREHPSIFY